MTQHDNGIFLGEANEAISVGFLKVLRSWPDQPDQTIEGDLVRQWSLHIYRTGFLNGCEFEFVHNMNQPATTPIAVPCKRLHFYPWKETVFAFCAGMILCSILLAILRG